MKQTRRTRLLIGALLLLVIGVAVVVAVSTGQGSSTSSGGGESTVQDTTKSGGLLSPATFCTWRLGRHHVPLTSQTPVRLKIDDRCNVPKDPNPHTDQPTGVYNVALQEPQDHVGEIRDGQEITLRCFTEGQAVSDAVGNSSNLWLGIVVPKGLMPDVDVGGGFTKNQLIQLHLPPC